MKGIIEKIEMYQNELEIILERMKSSRIKIQTEEISEEYKAVEESITTDTEIKSTIREMIEIFKEIKEKWEITIDTMMIIGKYFEENNDYINVMKTTKKYHDLVSMYHFNPIDDCSLFENMESQYFYSKPKDKTWLTSFFEYFGYGDKK